MRTTALFGILASAGLLAAAPYAFAQQPAPAAAQPERPVQPQAQAVEQPAVDLTRVEVSGLTADQVGARAAATSFSAKAQEEALKGAAARVDQAWASFLPRLSFVGRYTRLSDFAPPAIGFFPPGVNLVVAGQTGLACGPSNPCVGFSVPPTTFPLVLDNYLLQASIVVPISDYFLRIDQAYTAATHARDAVRFDATATKAKSAADGKAAYYTWLRARGAAVVAAQALSDMRTHLVDAKNQFSVGNASRADVLRAETAVAASELQVERANNLGDLAEKQVRLAIHAPEGERIFPGEGLDAPPPAYPGEIAAFTKEALTTRLEIKSIDANAAAAREQAKVARAGRIPQISAFADGIYANPNQRRFPQANEWFPTWDLGAQVTWSPNDAYTAGPQSMDAETRASALEAQRGAVRDGIELEVMQAWQGVKEGEVARESTARELASATEAYRVARELFNNGRATSTTLTDAETELTRARLDALNATVDARIARVRLDHAIGRDLRLVAPAP